MSAEPTGRDVACEASCKDWARGRRALLIWWTPIALLMISAQIGGLYRDITWPLLLVFMGVACLLNARGSGRIHCYVTGPFFLILALMALLLGLGVFTLGANGWQILSAVLVIGGAALTCVPEWIFGRYRKSGIHGAST